MIVETENMEPATDGIRGSSFLCGVLGVHIVCFFLWCGIFGCCCLRWRCFRNLPLPLNWIDTVWHD